MNNIKKNKRITRYLPLMTTLIGFGGICSASATINGPTGKFSTGAGIVWSAPVNETITVSASGTSDWTSDRMWASFFGIGKYQYYMWDCRRTSELDLANSSNGLYTGIKLAEDVILVLSGTATGKLGAYSGNGTWNEYGTYTSSNLPNSSFSWCGSAKRVTNYSAGDFATFSGKISLYVGPNAKSGRVTIPDIWLFKGLKNAEDVRALLLNKSIIEIAPPRICTVSTDNTITFPPVDITDAVNGKVLANKTGDFTVACDDATNAPVTVEIQGPKGRYTDAMALTMTDGSNAPAEVRGFIGSDIPLNGQCNGRLDGYQGIVYFVTNAGLEKMPIKPGTHKYNWVLCSKGEYKTGKATGSAKMIVSWD